VKKKRFLPVRHRRGQHLLQRIIDTGAVDPTEDRVGQRAWLGSMCFQRGFYLQNETFTIKET
jgi:hypothetical protein